MKQSITITVIATLLLWGCNSKPSKKPARYTDYEFGSYLYNIGKPDSAFLIYDRYINHADDTIKKAQAYRYMGEMLWTSGDLHGAEEYMASAIHTLDPLNEEHRAEIGYDYNALGNISFDLLYYDSAISYYNKAINVSSGTESLSEMMNGKATALQKMKRYNEAIAIYDSIFTMKPTDQELIARITDNRARTKWLLDPAYPALPEFWSALKIRTDSQYNLGLIASYAHLSGYYEKSNLDSALWYAQKMFEKAKEKERPDDILEAIDQLIRLSTNPNLKDSWYVFFKKLNDSLQFSRDTTRRRFAMIRYDFQKSKADNLILQQHITKQRLLMYGLIGLAVIIVTGITIWYNRRRKRIKQESEEAIQNAKLKTSQKVHDVVANGLYKIMNELEHSSTIDKDPLIDKIDDLYEKSRDISYEGITARNHETYTMQVQQLLAAFNNDQRHVKAKGNEQGFWNKVSSAQKFELELVLNELMINMKKHSQAKNVLVEFKEENNHAFITYSDDGVGFAPGHQQRNGLINTVNRIQALNGNITFGKSREHGALISISFPLQSKRI